MLKGEIIAVGTELLLGQIANTNAQFISSRMAEIGVPIYFHDTVGDNADRLKEVISIAKKRSNIIIITGGLGPTEDDITKDVLAEIINKKLILDVPSNNRIIEFFKQRKVIMTDNNKKQAMVIEGSDIFKNEYGLAVGNGIEYEGVYFILLPGPPSEMKPMLVNYVIPLVRDKYKGNIFYSEVMRFMGIGEAALEEKIIDLIKNQTNPTIAPLANDGEVTIRITANEKNEQRAIELIKPVEAEIHNRLANFHYGNGNESIEYTVYKLLLQSNLTISISESCTGGLVGSKFTNIAGSSKVYHGGVICYTNKIKKDVLNVPAEIIAKHGSVSKETAKLLAENTLKIFDTDLAIGITGIAGPDSVEDKPVGLVYIAISEKGKETNVKELNFSGNREVIQSRAAKQVFYLLWKRLTERLI